MAALVLPVIIVSSTVAIGAQRGPSPRSKINRPPARVYGLALAPGDSVPTLVGETLSGGSLAVDYGAHAATLVNFWATWCAPCRVEMPALQRIASERGGDDVFVVGVLAELDPDEGVDEFVRGVGVSYPIVLADLEIERVWGGMSVLPTTFLIDRDGRLVRRYVGASEAQIAGLIADLDAFLQGKPLPKQIFPESEDTSRPQP